jgi:hypothetical protein
MTRTDDASRQRPAPGEIVLDHVAHFLPDMTAAEEALDRLGFAPTPVSHQMHRTEPGGPLVSAGTANRTAMLRRGYLEFLATTGDTPNAAKLRAAMARYTGVHLVCFGTAEAAATQARLVAAGFDPPPAVALQREVARADGTTILARFAVMRAAPDRMPEGRVQFVEHLAPEAIWQPRYLAHPNGALALAGVVLAVEDRTDALARWQRFTGLAGTTQDGCAIVATARGRVILAEAATIAATYGATPPALPWIAGPVIGVADLAATRARLRRGGIPILRDAAARIVAAAPPALGGLYVFEPVSDPDLAGR